MGQEEAKIDDDVQISIELSGNYEKVIPKLRDSTDRSIDLDPLMADLTILLDTVLQMDGGTRSAIAQRLPDTTIEAYDGQAVVETMNVLERYDLVQLEGNTWKPGPALHRSRG